VRFPPPTHLIERLTQIYAEKKKTAPSVAEARSELGQQTVAEYVKQWRPRQRRMAEYSMDWHVDSSINVHRPPRTRSVNQLLRTLRAVRTWRRRKPGRSLPVRINRGETA
jgi:hypothetical protein